MQPSLLDYNEPTPYVGEMRRKRVETVKEVLREFPLARTSQKELLLQVWKKELGYNVFSIDNIRALCSSPSGIDRDRRRPEVLKEFPRKDDKFDAYLSYKDEFSAPPF